MTSVENGYKKLIGFEQVVDHFGNWPTFHDAEIIWLTLDRESQSGKSGPTLTMAMQGFIITNEVTPAGFCKTVKHCTVKFAFYDVFLEKLEDFNHQNAIMGLTITNSRQMYDLPLEVDIEGAHGLSCRFKCRFGQVLELVPGIPASSMYAGK